MRILTDPPAAGSAVAENLPLTPGRTANLICSDAQEGPVVTTKTRGKAVLTMIVLAAAPAAAQQNDVTFFVIGKHANYSQAATGELRAVDFSFFSEIFLTAGGDASAATLSFPTGEQVFFEDMRKAGDAARDNLLLVAGADRYTAWDSLQARYPDGDYRVSFDTPSGDVDARLIFRPRPLPPPPRITITQAGQPCTTPDANTAITVRWSPFDSGRSDPNGILDDLVFVILEDDEGLRVAHSGRPFEGRPYLTWNAAGYTIEPDALEPSRRYVLSVEHALLDDTTEFDGVPGFTTRAVTTKVEIHTAGLSQGACGMADRP